MKKILALMLVMCFLAAPVMALENGTSVKWGQVTLQNAAMGTTAAVTGTAYTFDNVMKYGACDLITGPSSGTSNVTLVLKGNQGSSATIFDTSYLIASTTLASSTTLTVMKTIPFASGVANPFRTIQAVITSPTTTQFIQLNCSAVQ